MILANIPLPENMRIPRSVRAASRRPEIDPSKEAVPFGADEWIACKHAIPHIDQMWGGDMFITLSVVSNHVVGDAHSPEPTTPIPRGYLFVINPMTRHWLFSEDQWRDGRMYPWVGLQWVVKRAKAKAVAKGIVQKLGGLWLPSADRRYEGWAQ